MKRPLIWQMRESPIRLLDIRRPYCVAQSIYREEEAVVAKAIEALLTVFDATDIGYQFNLAPGCRPDLAVIQSTTVLLVEVKARAITDATVRQATRYLEAGRVRWPDRHVAVVCVGTSLSPRLGPPPDGIRYGTVA